MGLEVRTSILSRVTPTQLLIYFPPNILGPGDKICLVEFSANSAKGKIRTSRYVIRPGKPQSEGVERQLLYLPAPSLIRFEPGSFALFSYGTRSAGISRGHEFWDS